MPPTCRTRGYLASCKSTIGAKPFALPVQSVHFERDGEGQAPAGASSRRKPDQYGIIVDGDASESDVQAQIRQGSEDAVRHISRISELENRFFERARRAMIRGDESPPSRGPPARRGARRASRGESVRPWARIPVRRFWSWHRRGVCVETLLKRYPSLGPARCSTRSRSPMTTRSSSRLIFRGEEALLGPKAEEVPGAMNQEKLPFQGSERRFAIHIASSVRARARATRRSSPARRGVAARVARSSRGALGRARIGGPLSARREADVGLPRVVGPFLPGDVSGPLETGQVAARGRGVDAEQRGERRRRHGAVLGNQLSVSACWGVTSPARARSRLMRPRPRATTCAARAKLPDRRTFGEGCTLQVCPGVKPAVPIVRRFVVSRPFARRIKRDFTAWNSFVTLVDGGDLSSKRGRSPMLSRRGAEDVGMNGRSRAGSWLGSCSEPRPSLPRPPRPRRTGRLCGSKENPAPCKSGCARTCHAANDGSGTWPPSRRTSRKPRSSRPMPTWNGADPKANLRMRLRRSGVAAAKANDTAAVKAACKGCHDALQGQVQGAVPDQSRPVVFASAWVRRLQSEPQCFPPRNLALGCARLAPLERDLAWHRSGISRPSPHLTTARAGCFRRTSWSGSRASTLLPLRRVGPGDPGHPHADVLRHDLPHGGYPARLLRRARSRGRSPSTSCTGGSFTGLTTLRRGAASTSSFTASITISRTTRIAW